MTTILARDETIGMHIIDSITIVDNVAMLPTQSTCEQAANRHPIVQFHHLGVELLGVGGSSYNRDQLYSCLENKKIQNYDQYKTQLEGLFFHVLF